MKFHEEITERIEILENRIKNVTFAIAAIEALGTILREDLTGKNDASLRRKFKSAEDKGEKAA